MLESEVHVNGKPLVVRSIVIGTLLGILHGIILNISTTDGFALASFMLFDRNPYFFGLLLALCIDIVIVTVVSTCVWWMPKVVKFYDEFIEADLDRFDPEDYEKELRMRRIIAVFLFIAFIVAVYVLFSYSNEVALNEVVWAK